MNRRKAHATTVKEDIQSTPVQGETSMYQASPTSSPQPSPGLAPQVVRRSRTGLSRGKRRLLIGLVVVLALLLILDCLMIFFKNSKHQPSLQIPGMHPTLTVTPATARPGQVIVAHLSNFPSSTQVLLLHDIQQMVRTDAGSSLIKMGANGDADVRVLVQDSWEPGNHMLVAEDTHTHYTASVSLQVISNFPARPPHLVVASPDQPGGLTSPLQMGAQVQGANTIQSLLLRNTGGSWISWKATSNQPWLMMAPIQGIFPDNQTIFIAATRAHLKPGDYQGMITIVSNTGSTVIVQVMMTTLPLPKITTAFMVIGPPVLSFTTTDGSKDSPSQQLDIRNAGVTPLNWTLAVNAPENLVAQSIDSQDVSWLNTNGTSGTIAPGGAAQIQVIVHSSNLLPGVYSGLLLLNADGNAMNAPQSVAISLTVQQRCGVATNQASLSFTFGAGQRSSISQSLILSTTPGCTDVTNWQSFPQPDWLSITPVGGQLQPGTGRSATLIIDAGKLVPGIYSGWIDFLTELRSQTLLVQVKVVSSASTVVISPGTPSSGSSNTPAPGSPTPIPTSTPGTPTLTPTPTPQPCTLQVAPLNLAFIASLTNPNPPGQQVVLKTVGNCAQPVTWTAFVSANSQNWLHLSATSGVLGNNGGTIVVNVNASGKLLGTYTGQITLTAVEKGGVTVQGSPQAVSITMTVIL